MSLGLLHPYQFNTLVKTYHSIRDLIDYFKLLEMDIQPIERLSELIDSIEQEFQLDIMKGITLTENLDMPQLFKRGVVKELDIINDKVIEIRDKVETIKMRYTTIIGGNEEWIKVMYSENDGYYLNLTKIRTKLLN